MALSYADLEGLWIAAGGPPDKAAIAAAITFPESGANPGSIQAGQPYATTGWGLWQITPGNSVPSVGVDRALLDPFTNAKAAVAKFRGAGNSFQPWVTYVNGAYTKYMQNGVPPNMNASNGQFVGSVNGIQGTQVSDPFGIGKAVTGVESDARKGFLNSMATFGNYGFIAGCVIGGTVILMIGVLLVIRSGEGRTADSVVRATRNVIGGPVQTVRRREHRASVEKVSPKKDELTKRREAKKNEAA